MANGDSGKGFFGNLFDKVKENLGVPQAQPIPGRNAGGLPPQQGMRGNPAPTGRLPASQSSTFVRTTGALSAPATSPLAFPPLERSPEQKEEESQKRLAFILAYLKDPSSVPAFRDSKYVYKIVSDERSYQSEVCANLEAELRQLLAHAEPYYMRDDEEIPAFDPGPDGELPPEVQAIVDRLEAKRAFLAERDRLETARQKSRDVQTKLFLILKQITGVKGKTGGTGFLTPPPGI